MKDSRDSYQNLTFLHLSLTSLCAPSPLPSSCEWYWRMPLRCKKWDELKGKNLLSENASQSWSLPSILWSRSPIKANLVRPPLIESFYTSCGRQRQHYLIDKTGQKTYGTSLMTWIQQIHEREWNGMELPTATNGNKCCHSLGTAFDSSIPYQPWMPCLLLKLPQIASEFYQYRGQESIPQADKNRPGKR